jgi:hypothetical protein
MTDRRSSERLEFFRVESSSKAHEKSSAPPHLHLLPSSKKA